MPATATRLHDAGANWLTGTVDGYKVQAKAFIESSHYGLEQDARISKLWIAAYQDGQWCVLFNYDRGLDFDNIDPITLQRVISEIGKRIR